MPEKKRVDPKTQFSKWLARYGAWFWGIYLLVIAFLIYSKPEAAMACVWLVGIVTANKMIDTLAYTNNSKTEKILLSLLDRTKMELTLKGTATSPSSESDESLETDESEEEGEING